MSTIDWVNLIYNDWADIFAPITFRGERNYHQNLAQGEHTLRDGAGICQLSLSQEFFCLEYEKIVTENFSNSAVLKNKGCTRRCDFVLFSKERNEKQTSLFLDLTSSKRRDTSSLEMADKKTGLTKFDKVQIQLAHTVKALSLSSNIAKEIKQGSKRIAVCAYRLDTEHRNTPNDLTNIQKAFNRPLKSEHTDGGQVYSSPELNDLGFEYRRIQYPSILSI